MFGLQSIQQPLGMTFPASPSSQSRRGLSTTRAERQLFQNIQESLNLTGIYELTSPEVDATYLQGFFQSAQPQIVLLQVKHHGTWHSLVPAEGKQTPLNPGPTPEGAELRWLREHQAEVAAYRGEWLLIGNNQLLAHSPDFGVIKAAVVANKIKSPFTYYVPTEKESSFVLL